MYNVVVTSYCQAEIFVKFSMSDMLSVSNVCSLAVHRLYRVTSDYTPPVCACVQESEVTQYISIARVHSLAVHCVMGVASECTMQL